MSPARRTGGEAPQNEIRGGSGDSDGFLSEEYFRVELSIDHDAKNWESECLANAARAFPNVLISGNDEVRGSAKPYETPEHKLRSVRAHIQNGTQVSLPKKAIKAGEAPAERENKTGIRRRRRGSAATLDSNSFKRRTHFPIEINYEPRATQSEPVSTASIGNKVRQDTGDLAMPRAGRLPATGNSSAAVVSEQQASTEVNRTAQIIEAEQGAVGLPNEQQGLVSPAGSPLDREEEGRPVSEVEQGRDRAQEVSGQETGEIVTRCKEGDPYAAEFPQQVSDLPHTRRPLSQEDAQTGVNGSTAVRRSRPYGEEQHSLRVSKRRVALDIIAEAKRCAPAVIEPKECTAATRGPNDEEILRLWRFSQTQAQGTVTGNPVDGLLKDLKDRGVDCAVLDRYHAMVSQRKILAGNLLMYLVFLKQEGLLSLVKAIQFLLKSGDLTEELKEVLASPRPEWLQGNHLDQILEAVSELSSSRN